MHWKCYLIRNLTSSLVFVFLGSLITIHAIYVSNLDESCIRCLCSAASGCNMKAVCEDGHCGPFQIEWRYWMDSGRPTLLDVSPNSNGAYESCATDYECSATAIKNYIALYGTDCNGDGVTDCDDFAMLNYNGRNSCDRDVTRNADGRAYLRRYLSCKTGFLKNNIFLTNN